MKEHYDFGKGERGKFYRKDAVFKFPIYLNDAKNQSPATATPRSSAIRVRALSPEKCGPRNSDLRSHLK